MIRILLCDDNQESLAILNNLIEETVSAVPYKLLYANSLAELKALCATERPHISFVDPSMEGSTEDEVLATLPDIPLP